MVRYDTLSDVQSDLLQQKIIDLPGEVDHDMFKYVREALMRLVAKDSPDITIIISSKGGDCDMGLNIFDLVKSYPGKTTGLVYGFANSMGSIILQACDVRLAAKHALLLIHNPRTGYITWEEMADVKKLNERRKNLEITRDAIIQVYLNRTTKSRKQIETAMKQAKNLSAEESLEFGLIDGIIEADKE